MRNAEEFVGGAAVRRERAEIAARERVAGSAPALQGLDGEVIFRGQFLIDLEKEIIPAIGRVGGDEIVVGLSGERGGGEVSQQLERGGIEPYRGDGGFRVPPGRR